VLHIQEGVVIELLEAESELWVAFQQLLYQRNAHLAGCNYSVNLVNRLDCYEV